MNKSNSPQIENMMQEFLGKLRQEYNIYETMLSICLGERPYIEKGELNRLRESLGKIHALLDEIVHIEKEIVPLKETWNRYKEIVPDPLKGEIKETLKSFKELMESLVKCQEENERIMSEYNVKKTEELGTVRRGKNMNKAYSVYGGNVPRSRFMDEVK